MIKLLANWILNALALYLVSRLVQGIHLASFYSALIAILLIGFINTLVRPVLLLLTLPITILTLGLFTFVINALLFMFAGNLLGGFSVDGFWAALWGSILLSVITTLLHRLISV